MAGDSERKQRAEARVRKLGAGSGSDSGSGSGSDSDSGSGSGSAQTPRKQSKSRNKAQKTASTQKVAGPSPDPSPDPSLDRASRVAATLTAQAHVVQRFSFKFALVQKPTKTRPQEKTFSGPEQATTHHHSNQPTHARIHPSIPIPLAWQASFERVDVLDLYEAADDVDEGTAILTMAILTMAILTMAILTMANLAMAILTDGDSSPLMAIFQDAMVDALGLANQGQSHRVLQFGYYESATQPVPIRSDQSLVDYLSSRGFYSKPNANLNRFWIVTTPARVEDAEEGTVEDEENQWGAPSTPSPPCTCYACCTPTAHGPM